MKREIYRIIAISFLLFTTLNASFSQEVDPKTMPAPEDKAIVYIVRPSGVNSFTKFKVSCDDKSIGITKGNHYIFTILEPGVHTFRSKAANKSVLVLNVEAGEKYYIKQKVTLGGVKLRNKLILLDEEEGIETLSKCKLMK
jgi:Protein of unknown function (DUF2846)